MDKVNKILAKSIIERYHTFMLATDRDALGFSFLDLLLGDCQQLAQAVIDRPLISDREAYQRGHAAGVREQKEKDTKIIQLHLFVYESMLAGKTIKAKAELCKTLIEEIRVVSE